MDLNQLQNLKSQFDESYYLEINQDVKLAVKQGYTLSGWNHYISYGFQENRKGVLEDLKREVTNLWGSYIVKIVPPEHLRLRVSGTKSETTFESQGRNLAIRLNGIISEIHPDSAKILDFGCGCGRAIKYLSLLSDKNKFYGTDIDDEAIRWCQNNISQVGTFSINPRMPRSPYDSESFDIIFSISVFTHLPEGLQFIWLKELKRITKKGGYLLLSINTEDLFIENLKPKSFKWNTYRKGFYYKKKGGTDGLPDFYQAAYHLEKYILKHWSKYFKIQRIIKNGVSKEQDLVVCKVEN